MEKIKAKRQILFVGNDCQDLALMAAAIAAEANNGNLDFHSAAADKSRRHRALDTVMGEIGLDPFRIDPLSMAEIEPLAFDLIITLGQSQKKQKLLWPDMPPHLHWRIAGPEAGISDARQVIKLRKARDQIKAKVADILSPEMVQAFFVTRQKFELILDNLIDGIMAHTANRRIFFFNQAAEQITGYRRQDILGRDCHEVFPGRFCGGDCDFCGGVGEDSRKKPVKRDVVFKRKDDTQRALNMALMPLTDENGQNVGALLSFKDNTELNLLKKRIRHHHVLDGLIGQDSKMLEIFEMIREVSATNVPVLISGESGTGKAQTARTIHNIGQRRNRAFVSLNCMALPAEVLAGELFGYGPESGAGNGRKKTGRLALADGGTLFLDEIGALPQALQFSLLEVLEKSSYKPLGSTQAVNVDVRIIGATSVDLRKLMEKNRFRHDLYYRLCVYPLTLPALRERSLDIPLLMDHFLARTAKEIKRPVLAPTTDVLDRLIRYPWPGNARELQNAIEYAYVKCRGEVIEIAHLPPEIINFKKKTAAKPGPALKKKEQVLLAMAKASGNKKMAAKHLGVSPATLYRYLDTYRLK